MNDLLYVWNTSTVTGAATNCALKKVWFCTVSSGFFLSGKLLRTFSLSISVSLFLFRFLSFVHNQNQKLLFVFFLFYDGVLFSVGFQVRNSFFLHTMNAPTAFNHRGKLQNKRKYLQPFCFPCAIAAWGSTCANICVVRIGAIVHRRRRKEKTVNAYRYVSLRWMWRSHETRRMNVYILFGARMNVADAGLLHFETCFKYFFLHRTNTCAFANVSIRPAWTKWWRRKNAIIQLRSWRAWGMA